MRSINEECLDRRIFFGEEMLRETIHSYLEHYPKPELSMNNCSFESLYHIAYSNGYERSKSARLEHLDLILKYMCVGEVPPENIKRFRIQAVVSHFDNLVIGLNCPFYR